MIWFIVILVSVAAGIIAYFSEKEQQARKVKIAEQRLSEMVTSSDESIPGRRILRKIKVVSAEGGVLGEVETDLLFEAREAGANAVINMKIDRVVAKGGVFSDDIDRIAMQGDAVVIE